MSDAVEPDVDGDGDVTAGDVLDQPVTGSGPVAVVTGASRGIGRHIADALEEAGWIVERGSSGLADVTDREALHAWVGDIIGRRGRIDLLVNNAGVIDTEVDLFASDPQQWWHTCEVNVLGAYLMTWLVGGYMLSGGGGRIINLNSGSGTHPGAVASAYNVSKSALARITGSTHLAGWDRGIRAFDLMPGVVRTDMTGAMQAHLARTEWTSPQQVTDLVLALAGGELDAWSGRFLRAGVDTVSSLLARQHRGELERDERTLVLRGYGPEDPLTR